MSMPYGSHEARVYYVQESNYGETPQNPSMTGLKAEHVEPMLNPNLFKLRGIGSRDLQSLRAGLREVTLDIAYPLPDSAPTNFLQHVITLSSLSVEVFYEKTLGIVDLLHTGCRFNKASVGCEIEGVISATVELLGQDITVNTSKVNGATYADYAGAVPYYESYVQRGSGDGSGLSAVERVTDWKWTVENNLKQIPVIRQSEGYLLKYLPARHRNLTGEVIFEFESKQEFDDVINDEDFSLKFGLGGSNSAMFKYCKWENVSAPTKIEDLVTLRAGFVGKDLVIS